jgi:hypothetical protein
MTETPAGWRPGERAGSSPSTRGGRGSLATPGVAGPLVELT